MLTIIEGQLYKWGLPTPLLKCLYIEDATYVLINVYQGISGKHVGEKALAKNILRVGYFWPMMKKYAQGFGKNVKDVRKMLKSISHLGCFIGAEKTSSNHSH